MLGPYMHIRVFLCDCVRMDGPGDRRRQFYGCTVAGPSLLMWPWGCAPAEASLACRAGRPEIDRSDKRERDRETRTDWARQSDRTPAYLYQEFCLASQCAHTNLAINYSWLYCSSAIRPDHYTVHTTIIDS
jgi:hypothetical protein